MSQEEVKPKPERIIDSTLLEKLVNSPSPTGSEQPAQRIYREYLKNIAEIITTDVMGNVCATLNSTGSPKIMLAGHVDEVGLQIRYIDEKGYISVNQLGGIDAHIVPGSRVKILTEKGEIFGIMGRKAIHLLKPEDRKKVTPLKDQYLDVGASSREEIEEMGIQIGDPIVWEEKYAPLGNKGVVVSRCFDDKVAVFIIAEVLRLLKKESFDGVVYGVSTTQEEVGTRGAQTSAFGLDPDVGIALDVTHASDTPDVKESDGGKVILGGGPAISRGPNTNPRLFKLFVDTAKELEIPIQIRAARGPTGTDARIIQMTRSGVATGLIGIPNRYMHTMSEVVHLDDLDATVRLLVAVIKKITKDMSFIPE